MCPFPFTSYMLENEIFNIERRQNRFCEKCDGTCDILECYNIFNESKFIMEKEDLESKDYSLEVFIKSDPLIIDI